MNFNIKLFFIMLTILFSGAFLTHEEEETSLNIKETENIIIIENDELLADYADKYPDIYKHKHEPHNRHNHKLNIKNLFKRRCHLLF